MPHITTIITRNVDLNEGVRHVQHLPHRLICGNDQAHEFRIICTRSGEAADLTGAVCTGFVRRADGVTIPVEGSISGSTASMLLTAACYQRPGQAVISIDLEQDGAHATHAVWIACVESIQTAAIGGEAAVSITDALTRAEAAAERAESGASPAWYVTLAEGGDGAWTADKTLAEIRQAHDEGRVVRCDVPYGLLTYTLPLLQLSRFGADFGGYSQGTDAVINATAYIALDGSVQVRIGEVATTLPNPSALTFTGAVSATYDGSGAVTVEIPKADPATLTPLFADSVEECADPSLLYVLPDGYIYACMETTLNPPEITIEAQSGGYWYGNSYNPTGLWDAMSDASAKRTNIIPVTPGDQLSYQGYASSTPDSVVWLDENQAYLSDETHDAKTTPVTVTAPEGAAYAWFSSFDYTSSADNVILDVKWILCQASSTVHQWTNTGHAFVPADYEGRIIDLESAVDALQSATAAASVTDTLARKRIVYDGDSIAESRLGSNANGGGYAQIIADLTGGSCVNQAVGSARLCSCSGVHSVVDNLSNLPSDGDLYCFEGGVNDFWADTPIGEITAGYTDAVDAATICGAMETIFRHCLTNLPGKPVCFVIAHKVQNTAVSANGNGDTFTDYHDAMVKACQKYSIPYYDAFLESGLNGWNTAQSNAYLTANSTGTGDGIHPNEAGYRRYYVPQLLDLFRRLIPVE